METYNYYEYLYTSKKTYLIDFVIRLLISINEKDNSYN